MNAFLDERGLHEVELRRHFQQFEVSGDIEPLNSPVCIMLFTNRSGSSLTTEYLLSTSCFSGLGEPLNYRMSVKRANKRGIESFLDYVRLVYNTGHREGTMFGMKANYGQAMMLMRSGVIPAYFNGVRWLVAHRRDVVSQAVSYSIAFQTKKWRSYGSETEQPPKYEFEQIRHRVQSLSQAYAAIDAFCSVFDIKPYRIEYEEFSKDPMVGAQHLVAHLGYPDAKIDESKLRMRMQRNNINHEFRERFLEDYRRYLGVQ